GQVGIGTTQPTAILDISATNSALRVSRLTNASTISSLNGMIAYDSIQNQLQGYINGTWVDLTASSSSSGNFVVRTGDSMTGSLIFSGVSSDIRTAGTEDLALVPGGQVGIGTTNAVAILDISASNNALRVTRLSNAATIN